MRKNATIFLFLIAWLCGARLAVAQGHYEANPVATTKFERPEKTQSASREFEIPIQTTLEFSGERCEATLQIGYSQRNEVADVTSTLDNSQCGASSGQYTVRILVRAADGTTSTSEFPQTWHRSDAKPLVETRQFPVGKDTEVLRVRTRGLTCACLAAAAQDP